MSDDRLREAARAVLATRVGFTGESPLAGSSALVADGALTELRAALDAEPEPSPTNEELAAPLAAAVKNVLWRAERGEEIKHLRWVALREALDTFERGGKPVEISDPEQSPPSAR